jgi:hypothetical protein
VNEDTLFLCTLVDEFELDLKLLKFPEPKFWQTNQNANEQTNLTKQNINNKSLEAQALLILL